MDDVSDGLYWFVNSERQIQQLYVHNFGAFASPNRYVLIASNNAKESVIPTGTEKNSFNYRVDRNGVFGALGTPDPEKDYIAGDFISGIDIDRIKVFGWGWNSLDGSTSFSGATQGTTLEVTWNRLLWRRLFLGRKLMSSAIYTATLCTFTAMASLWMRA